MKSPLPPICRISIALCALVSAREVAFAANFFPNTVAGLVADITTANVNGEDDVIDLGGLTFSLTAVDGSADGQNGLPSITEAGFTLTIRNGTIERAGGAALRLLHVGASGSLILDDVSLSNGLALEAGTGVGRGGAIFSRGTLSIAECRFTGNVASGTNGLLAPADGLGGAIHLAAGSLVELRDSTFSSNQAVGGNALTTVLGTAGSGRGGALHFGSASSVGRITGTVFGGNEAIGGDAASALLQGGEAGSGEGGAIHSDAVSWTALEDCVFEQNVSTGGDGASSASASFAAGGGAGAVALFGSHLGDIRRTRFVGNVASGGAPAPGVLSEPGGNASGGALRLDDASTITVLASSTFDGNRAVGAQAAAVVGGAIDNRGTLTIVDSTLSDNAAGNGNASCTSGASGDGGAIDNPGSLALTNSTLSGNRAGSGGLLCAQATGGNGGAIHSTGTLTIVHATVSGNAAGQGGAGGGVLNGGTAALAKTIVAGNTAATGSNCSGTVTDAGSNLSDDATCGFGAGDAVDPLLDPQGLRDNGGPTRTIALLSTSPALDAIPDGSCTETTDQRGFARPVDGPDADLVALCDVGAFELSFLCGNETVDDGEQCDRGAANGTEGSCCTSSCELRSSGETCRASAGACDVAETCSGAADSCPPDEFLSAANDCRAAADACDVAESCDGSSASCPVDTVLSAGTECRASVGACDVAESCDGSAVACPADAVVPAGTECRASTGPCDMAEGCDGSGATCPSDAFRPASQECRAAASECDVAESCTGSSADCPENAFAAESTPCVADGFACTEDSCDGDGGCVAHPDSTVCDDQNVCTNESCTVDRGCVYTNDPGCAEGDPEPDDDEGSGSPDPDVGDDGDETGSGAG